MSHLVDAITRELGPDVLAQVGARVGATPQQTQSVAASAIPMLVSALASNTTSPNGAAALAGALDRDHGPNLIDQLGPLAGMLGGAGGGASGGLGALLGAAASAMGGSGAQVPTALRGDKILGHVLGPQQSSATQAVARASGVDASTVAALLPVLAPIVMSALGSTKQQQRLDAGGLGSFLAREASQLGAPSARPASSGFDADDLAKIGGAIARSGLLGKLFG